MSGSERSDGFETSRQPEMSSEDAAELEQLRREAAALRVQLQEVASAPGGARSARDVHQLEARIDSLAARNAKLMETLKEARQQLLALREEDFATAAVLMGASPGRVIGRHLLPSFTSHLIASLTLSVPSMILGETALSFLGLGIQEPMTSWGVLIQDGAKTMEATPWILLFPAALLSITLYCFNFIGDGLRDALDPKER